MKNRRYKNLSKGRNNQGFSLIELIISITILVLIMLPLMNNFFRSMQMNKKAEEIQVQSNLAASIMEGLKSHDMKSTIEQFTGLPANFTIITDGSGSMTVEALNYDSVTGLYQGPIIPTDGQAAYYFAIHGIREGSTAYDALITMSSSNLRAVANIMNDYPMPDAINLDARANGLLLSNGQTVGDSIDNAALTTYLQWGNAYAENLFLQSAGHLADVAEYNRLVNEKEIAEMNGTTPTLPPPPPTDPFDPTAYPTYCDETTVKSYLTKKMKINVNQTTTYSINYQVEYECNWPTTNIERIIQYPISKKNYAKQIETVYLFYQPSIFKDALTIHPDKIDIVNETPAKAINFYVARQLGGTLLPDISIYKYSLKDQISVFTNLESIKVKLFMDGIETTGGTNAGIVKSQAKDRIYEVDVKIYEYTDIEADKYKKLLYSLSSTREN